MHAALGTSDGGGTVRFSPGYANTIDEIDALVHGLHEIAGGVQALRTSERTHA
jgi:selenocysteine lyase/cysteine desulfurase